MSEPEILIFPSVQPWIPGNASDLRDEITARITNDKVRVAHHSRDAVSRMSKANIGITNEFTPRIVDAADQLEWIQTLSAGTAKYPLDQLDEKDVRLTSASGVHAEPIAEQVLGYMLVFERRLHQAVRQQSQRRWQRFYGGEIRDKTLGIIGVGTIGKRIAELSSFLDMRIIGTKRTPEESPAFLDDLFGPDGLYDVLSESDYLVIACPLTEETQGLLQRPEFNSMKESAVLVNIARGAIVPEQSLIEALQSGRIRGAALDVFETEPLPPDSRLWDLPNALITPHSAGLTPHYLSRCADVFAENYERFQREDELINRVL